MSRLPPEREDCHAISLPVFVLQDRVGTKEHYFQYSEPKGKKRNTLESYA